MPSRTLKHPFQHAHRSRWQFTHKCTAQRAYRWFKCWQAQRFEAGFAGQKGLVIWPCLSERLLLQSTKAGLTAKELLFEGYSVLGVLFPAFPVHSYCSRASRCLSGNLLL